MAPGTMESCECWLVDMAYSTVAADGAGSISCRFFIPLLLFGQKCHSRIANEAKADSKREIEGFLGKVFKLQRVHACAVSLAY